MYHDSFVYVIRHTQWLCVHVRHNPMSRSLIPICAMTYSYMWHDTRNDCVCVWDTFPCLAVSLTCVPWLIPICDTSLTNKETVRHIPMSHSLINMCATTHSYMYAMTNSYMRHDPHNDCVCVWNIFLCLTVSFTCVPWLIPICDTSHKGNEGCGMR